MRNYRYLAIIIVLIFFIKDISAQNIGINTTGAAADASSLLDIDASPGNNMGLLIPRIALTATNSALPITAPTTSLLIYNTATAGASPNNVSPGYYYWGGTIWIAFETNEDRSSSVNASANLTTTSTADVVVSGMTLSPGEGTYNVNFNSQCAIPDAIYTTGLSTADLCTDLNLIYNEIDALTVTDSTRALAFGATGAGEILPPGVYSLTGAITLANNLTLDGGGNTNAIFVIRGSSTFGITAGATVTLINGASPENVLWVAETGISIGANTTISGTIFSNGNTAGAIPVGANCIIEGRLLTKAGAMAFGPGTLSLPTLSTTFINLQRLASFVMFTCAGAIANTGASTYTGDIGTNGGAITGFTAVGCVVNGTIYQAGTTVVVTPVVHEATFSLYQNGVLIPNSSRTRAPLSAQSDISLHGIATVLAGQPIDVRWKTDTQTSDSGGSVSVANRILSITKVK